jgi:DNA-binding response OmpR family regulator
VQEPCDDLALVPIWAVRHHDQIRARFDASLESDLRKVVSQVDRSIRIERSATSVLALDGMSYTVVADGTPLPLSPRGFRVLEYLITADRIVPTDELTMAVWGSSLVCSSSTLRALIHNVRRSLPPSWSASLTTVRLQGYFWTVDGREPGQQRSGGQRAQL